MPYGRRRYTKRKYGRRNRSRFTRRRRVTRRRTRQPFPNKKVLCFKYVTTIALGNGVDPFAGHTFRANSLYDPDYTGVGHQPYGVDQWSSFFNQYYVYKSSIRCQFASAQPGGIQCIAALERVTDPDTSTDLNTVSERPGSKSTIVIPQRGSRLSIGWRARKAWPMGKDDSQSSYFSGSPLDTEFYRVFVAGQNTTAVPMNGLLVKVTLRYWTVLFDTRVALGS